MALTDRLKVKDEPKKEKRFQSPWLLNKDPDATLYCLDWKFFVHQEVICKADYFRGAFSNFKEGRTGEMCIQGEDPEAVEVMLNWLYYGTLPHLPKDESHLLLFAKTWVLADRCQIEGLGPFATEHLSQELRNLKLARWAQWELDVVQTAATIYESIPEKVRREDANDVCRALISEIYLGKAWIFGTKAGEASAHWELCQSIFINCQELVFDYIHNID